MSNGGNSLQPLQDIRRNQMRALLDDLHQLEKQGLEDNQCSLVLAALTSVASAATEIPDGSFWSGTILREAERVCDAYERWNGVRGNDFAAATARKAALRKLRKRRQRLTRRMHLNQYVLQNELDKKLVTNMYSAFGKVVERAPDIFANLARAAAQAA